MTGSDAENSDERTFTAKGLATRERIVEVAAALMYSGGVAGTSWEDVQNGAGVSASQLYHYFGDKQAGPRRDRTSDPGDPRKPTTSSRKPGQFGGAAGMA